MTKMDIIGKEEFDEAENLPEPPKLPKPFDMTTSSEMTEERFQSMMENLKNPVEAQKEIAVRLKNYLDQKMDKELGENGYLSDSLRRWVTEYNGLLEKIQKALYGDKSVNLHLHKVSHSHIASKIRRYADKNDKNINPSNNNISQH